MADLLKYGRIADDGEILSSMRDVWEHLTKAHEHWHHPLKDSGQSETLSMMQGSNYTYDQHCGHRLSFLENCMFLSIAGEVLRKEVFEKDLLSELRAQSLLPESLGPLKECEQPMHDKRTQIDAHLGASTVYNFLVVAYFWQQSYHLDENALRAYDAKFEARLGKYDSTCYKHLQEATCVSIQLRLYLLLVDEVYKFEYPKDIEVDDSKTGAALQGCHVVLPAVRSKGNTVVKCRSVCVSRGSDFAKVTGPGKE